MGRSRRGSAASPLAAAKTEGPGRRLCFLRSDGYKSSKATPSKRLGRQGALGPPPPLRVLLTPPAQVGVCRVVGLRWARAAAEKLPEGGFSLSSHHDGCRLGDCAKDALPVGATLPCWSAEELGPRGEALSVSGGGGVQMPDPSALSVVTQTSQARDWPPHMPSLALGPPKQSPHK